MKLLVAGTRTFNNYSLLESKLNEYKNITEIISGGAQGADYYAEVYANKYKIKLVRFLPKYNEFKTTPKYAPLARNIDMAKYCDQGIIFWDERSSGTKHMINQLQLNNKATIIVKYLLEQ